MRTIKKSQQQKKHINPHSYRYTSTGQPFKPQWYSLSHHEEKQETLHFGIHVFRMIRTMNSDYFPKHYLPINLCNAKELCSL
jgi:hypothetical protein